MPTYQYIAKTPAGEEVSGLMQGDSEAAVVRTLDDREMFPVSVRPHADRKAARGGRVRIRDLSVMYGQLSDLLRAGVPMLRALDTLSKALQNGRLCQILVTVREDVAAGETFAASLANHPETFKSLHSAMVRAGEQAGFLEDVLANLSQFLDRQDDLRNKVRGSLVYPAVLTVLGTVAVLVMLTVFVPKFEKFFAGLDQPLPTEMLFAASNVLLNHWAMLAAGVFLAVVAVVGVLQSTGGRQAWERWQLKLPILGKLVRTVCISRFCRIFGTMLHNGVPILQALDISKDAAGNAVLADTIATAAKNVEAGETLSGPLQAGGLFPPEILEMIAVAEESNQLDKVLVQIADTVDRRTSRQLDQAVRLVEPLILVVIAGVIGFIAVGLLYPIFTMSDKLG